MVITWSYTFWTRDIQETTREANNRYETSLVGFDKESGDIFAVALGDEWLAMNYVQSEATGWLTSRDCRKTLDMVIADDMDLEAEIQGIVRWLPPGRVRTITRCVPSAEAAAVRKSFNQMAQDMLMFACKQRSSQPNMQSTLFPWAIRHTGWLWSRFGVSFERGAISPYHIVHGYGYGHGRGMEIYTFGQTVHFRVPGEREGMTGLWCGKSMHANDHIVLTPYGAHKIKHVDLVAVDPDDPEPVAACGVPWEVSLRSLLKQFDGGLGLG